MIRFRWLSACALIALTAHAQNAPAQGGRNITCLGELGDTRVDGNVDVVGRCTLNGTDVHGNVRLFSGGSLTARAARIRGNLDGTRADFDHVSHLAREVAHGLLRRLPPQA